MDLWQMFGQHPSEISLIFNATLQMVYQNKIHLEYVNNVYWMQVDYLYSYAHTVSDKGTALDACIGFMDGSTKPIARLTENLSVTFSGHKRVHCLRFQSLLLPNGLIGHMSSPLEGRRHDAILLWESDILGQLQQLYRHDRRPFTVYGNPAFRAQKHLISPIKRHILTDQERGFNTSMSVVWECVEWGSTILFQIFAFVDFRRNLEVFPAASWHVLPCVHFINKLQMLLSFKVLFYVSLNHLLNKHSRFR